MPPIDSWAERGLNQGERRVEQIAVDTTDHQLIYAAGSGGLYRSGDGAATWKLTLASSDHLLSVAASPANPHVLYVVHENGRLELSDDAGSTWRTVPGEVYNNAGTGGSYGCDVEASPFVADPLIADRLVLAVHCLGSSALRSSESGTIDQSPDGGVTRLHFFQATHSPALAGRLVGGKGAAAARFYVSTDPGWQHGASSLLYRTNDNGANWSELTGMWDATTDDYGQPQTTKISGLAYDPSHPDRVYIGLNRFDREQSLAYTYTVPIRSWTRASSDGGQTWTDLGCADLGGIQDLALGIDGRNLYAGTISGVWRLPQEGIDTPTGCAAPDTSS